MKKRSNFKKLIRRILMIVKYNFCFCFKWEVPNFFFRCLSRSDKSHSFDMMRHNPRRRLFSWNQDNYFNLGENLWFSSSCQIVFCCCSYFLLVTANLTRWTVLMWELLNILDLLRASVLLLHHKYNGFIVTEHEKDQNATNNRS